MPDAYHHWKHWLLGLAGENNGMELAQKNGLRIPAELLPQLVSQTQRLVEIARKEGEGA